MQEKIQNFVELRERIGFDTTWDKGFIHELNPEGKEGMAKIQLIDLNVSEGEFRYIDKEHLEAIGELERL